MAVRNLHDNLSKIPHKSLEERRKYQKELMNRRRVGEKAAEMAAAQGKYTGTAPSPGQKYKKLPSFLEWNRHRRILSVHIFLQIMVFLSYILT